MVGRLLPETTIDSSLKREIDAIAGGYASLEDVEVAALTTDLAAPLRGNQRWVELCDLINTAVGRCGYIVLRGIGVDEGRSLLIVCAALGLAFDTYRPRRVVKRFRMSPWTDELSHTIRAGDFHTDGNVSAVPPVGTAMQCELEDPGAPDYAEQRVAHLPDLLEQLASGVAEDAEALAFLTEAEVAMAHERSPEVWRGRLVVNGTIRYHPQSLRVASRRLGESSPQLESKLAAIHRAALDVSVPFHTSPGDTVLVLESNRAALPGRLFRPIHPISDGIRGAIAVRPALERAERVSKAGSLGSPFIDVIGADANNLKEVDVTFPLKRISVVTGVSGSGKSSLLADTLGAEGSRRMRLFLGTSQQELESDDVRAFIGVLPPTILVGQRGFRPTVRTTVGTATGFLSVLRRLFILASAPYSGSGEG